MSKFLICFIFLILCSCARENFEQTELLIGHNDEQSRDSSKIWLNIFNPELKFFYSTILPPGEKKHRITLPNASGYIIYGMSFISSAQNKKVFIPMKYFKKEISLQEGGTNLVTLDLAKENLKLLADNNFIDEDGTPLKIVFNPCSENYYNNCKSGTDFAQSGIGSLRLKMIQHFSNFENNSPFSQNQMFWMSQCVSSENLTSFFVMIRG